MSNKGLGRGEKEKIARRVKKLAKKAARGKASPNEVLKLKRVGEKVRSLTRPAPRRR